jgi:hypothetical protein
VSRTRPFVGSGPGLRGAFRLLRILRILRISCLPLLPAAGVLADGAPRLVLEAPRRDAGTIVRGETVRVSWVLGNGGSAPLHVSEVRPSCGCAVASFDKVIAAGGTGSLTLTVDTKSLAGAVSRSAVIVTDDPATPQATVWIAAVVSSPVEVLPAGTVRVELFGGRGGAGSQILVSRDPAFHPAGAETGAAWLKASLEPVAEAGRISGKGASQFRLTVTVGPDAPEGLLGGAVKVRTGLARPPVVEVPLSGFVLPSVSLSSARIDFRNFVPGWQPVRRFLVLTSNDPSAPPLALLSAASTVKGITATSESKDARHVEVTLTAEPTIPIGPFEGELVLRTNDPLKPSIRVPVKGAALVREK